MLSLESLHFSYGSNAILRDVSLELRANECVCIVGPNGSGKSTLLRLAAGLLTPTQGSVRLKGSMCASIPREQMAKQLSYLPQHVELAFPFKAEDVVLMGRYAHQSRWSLGLDSKRDRAKAEHAMMQTKVEHLAKRIFADLSGGELRRVLVAQALCQESEILLLDEPTAALDPAHAHELFAILTELKKTGRAIAVVTHDLNLAMRYADRLVVLSDGEIVQSGTPAESVELLEQTFGLPIHHGTLPSGDSWLVPG